MHTLRPPLLRTQNGGGGGGGGDSPCFKPGVIQIEWHTHITQKPKADSNPCQLVFVPTGREIYYHWAKRSHITVLWLTKNCTKTVRAGYENTQIEGMPFDSTRDQEIVALTATFPLFVYVSIMPQADSRFCFVLLES